jgi:mono/diheme cytochrome c family protein
MVFGMSGFGRAGVGALLIAFVPAQAGANEAALSLGKKVFIELSSPQCALCHTLADAGSSGAVGPVLDELKPDAGRVKAAVTNGIGPMPPNDGLTNEQIEAVALYVSTVAGRATSR